MDGFERALISVGCAAAVWGGAASARAALVVSEVGKITPSNSGYFGTADLSGTTLLIGGPGKAYVYDKGTTGWTETGTGLSAGSDPVNQRFAQALALDGDTALIGASGKSGESGVAYVFDRGSNGWALGPTLTSDTPSADDGFGASVAISGTVAAVVATGDDAAATDAGAVFVYELASGQWQQKARLVPPMNADTTQQLHYFAVSVTASAVFVGAAISDYTTREIEVFERSGATWTQVGTLKKGGFPSAFAASGDTLVGADTGANGSAGALYVYRRGATSWNYETTLTAPAPQAGEIMGASLAFSGNVVVAGTYGSASGAQNSGGAVVFERTGSTWSSGVRFWGSDAQALDYTGSSAAVDGQNAAVFSSARKWGYVLHIGASAADPCTSSEECAAGACADGVCCDRACDGPCESCLASSKGQGSDGTCGPIAAGTDPDAECDDEGAESCGQDGSCDGAAACALYARGTVCKAATCASSATVDPADTCDGNGACVANDAIEACAPLSCVAGACVATCAADADCATGFSCDVATGECRPAALSCSADGADLLDPSGLVLAHCTPYVCAGGRCLDQCATTTDCAAGFVCDPEAKRCAAPAEVPPSSGSDGGCGCRTTSASGSRPLSSIAGVICWLLVRSRRRRTRR